MDIEIEAPVDDLEAVDAAEDDEQPGYAVANPSNHPDACS